MNNVSLVAPGVWRICDDFVSVYYIRGEKQSLFIDAGVGGLDFAALAEELGGAAPVMAITHADFDHVGGSVHFPGEIRMHPADYWYLEKNLPDTQVSPLWEGDVLDLGDRKLEVIHIPGHTPGGIVLLDRENRLLFGGDAVQINTPIYLFGDARNIPAYIDGLEKLHGLSDLFDDIYPGHGQAPLHPEDILTIQTACRLQLAGRLDPEPSEPGLPCQMYRHQDVILYV